MSSAIDKFNNVGLILHFCSSGAEAVFQGVNYVVNIAEIFNSTVYLKSTTLLSYVPSLYKNLKKCCTQEKKLWPALKAIHSSFIMSITISNIISLAMTVSNVVTRIFAGIGVGCAALQLTRDGEKMNKYQLQLKNFTESVGYNKQGRYNVQNYERLCSYINEVGTEALAKQFNVDENSFKQALSLKLKNISPLHGQFQENKLREIMDLFKTRLEYKKRSCIVSLITDGMNLIGGALLVVPVAAPFLIPFLASFNTTVGTIQFVANKISLYQFENQMEMINRGTVQYQPGIKDFFMWCFNSYPKSKPDVAAGLNLKAGWD